MLQPRRWWIGIIPLAMIWYLANTMETPRIEQDLALRSAPAVAAASRDIVNPEIAASGRDITLSGAFLQPDATERAIRAADNVNGVRRVIASLVSAKAESPYVLSAMRDGNAITLTGFAPTNEIKGRLLAAVRTAMSDGRIEDQLKLAAGASSQLEALAAHGFQQLAKLAKGRFSLSDLTYSLEGIAADAKAYAELASLASALPAGATAGTISVTPPATGAFTFAVQREGDTLILSGFVSSLAERNRLLEAARKAFPNLKIEDRLQFASNTPPNFASMAEHGLALAGRLLASRFELSGATYHLEGAASDHEAYDAAIAALASLPAGATAGKVTVQPPEVKPFAWRARLLLDGRIVIEGVAPDKATLDAILAEARKLYPNATIESTMRIARTAPEGFAEAARLALAQLGRLKSGSIVLSDRQITVEGDAGDMSVADAITSALQAIKGSFQIASLSISAPPPPPPVAPPPVVVSAPPDPPAPASAEAKAEVKAEELPEAKPAPEVVVDIPMPPQAELNVDEPKPLPPAPVTPPQVSPTPPAMTAEADKPATAPPPKEERVTQKPPPISCDNSKGAPLKQTSVLFDEGSYKLSDAQIGPLKELLAVLKACPASRAILAGHTNSHGDRAGNIRLSSLRSFAASRWLQDNGIPKRRIETIGFGEDRPPVSEASADGVVQNRRVEITIR